MVDVSFVVLVYGFLPVGEIHALFATRLDLELGLKSSAES